MGWVQKVMRAIVPSDLARAIEAESRLWVYRCPDGHEVSIWDLGGIRYKAIGEPTAVRRCPDCGRIRKVKLVKKPMPDAPPYR